MSTLISASVVLESGSPTRARLYVAVFIEDEDEIIQATLFRGYVYDQHPVNGNGALVIKEGDRLRIESKSSLSGITLRVRGRQLRNQAIPGGWTGTDEGTLEGQGFVRQFVTTNPAQGTLTITETVPTNARWKVRSASVALVTNATAANRHVAVIINDGQAPLNPSYEVVSLFVHTANTLIQYFFVGGGVANMTAAVGSDIVTAMGNTDPLLAGWTFALTVLTGGQGGGAGDNLTAAELSIEEWLE